MFFVGGFAVMILYRLFTFVVLLVGFGMPQNANAHFIDRFVNLSGPSGASGSGRIQLDLDLVVMHVDLQFTGLTGTTTSSQLFAIPKANQAALAAVPFVQFPLNVTNGTYTRTIDLTQASAYSPAFLIAADTGLGQTISDALEAVHDGADDFTAFIRINTTAFPNGEISGFLTAVPEPSSSSLLTIAMLIGASIGTPQILRKWKTKPR